MTQQAEKVKLKPLSDRVILKRLDPEDTLKGGLILPDTAKKKQETAQVVAIGPGRKAKSGESIPMPVSIGDKVLIDQYSGQEIEVEGEEYLIVKADDIIAIVA